MQTQLGQNQIQAFELPTKVARYDTTSFSVHHQIAKPGEEPHDLLRFGYSKDHRPDLLQFKQGLGTLDPAGIPIFTQTLSGETADDGLYIPAWQEMVQTIGHRRFLFVSDSKAANIETRATLADQNGRYLFPLPLTGHTPEWLQTQVFTQTARPIVFEQLKDKNGQPKTYGVGFVVTEQRTHQLMDGTAVTWEEQCFVTQSNAHAQRQRQAIQARLTRTHEQSDQVDVTVGCSPDSSVGSASAVE